MLTYYHAGYSPKLFGNMARDLFFESIGIPFRSYLVDLSDFCWN